MTETKMEVVKLMPKEYNKAEANAFKHGFFLGARSEREEVIERAVKWLESFDAYRLCVEGYKDVFIEQFKQAMKKGE
jgi:hypothetical protein